MVIRSIVEECSSEWYRLGRELGLKGSHINAITSHIPTPQGKFQAIIDIKSREDGTRQAVEAVLDVCDQIIPLATVAVMQDLGIKHNV